MTKNQIIKMHVAKGATPTFTAKNVIGGGILKLPQNIITSTPEQEFIYEMDGRVLTIYNDGHKVKNIKCEQNYVSRLIILIDMMARCVKQGYEFQLTQIVKDNGKALKKDPLVGIFEVLLPSEGLDTGKEKTLFESMKKIIDGNDETIDQSVEPGYDFIINHYLEVKNNES